jgi:cytochrome b pre-mRNA-processing protein 3
MILRAFRRGHHDRNIHALYGAIVAQARSAAFYRDYGVSDTVEGRFELIVLHLVLVLRCLGGEQPGRVAGGPAGQELFDVFCRDLDHNLREMGTGDLAVPRKMRRFGEAFYGRQSAYCAALDTADDRKLEKALARNIFGAVDIDDRAARLTRYVRAAAVGLGAAEPDALMAAKIVFPRPETFAHG